MYPQFWNDLFDWYPYIHDIYISYVDMKQYGQTLNRLQLNRRQPKCIISMFIIVKLHYINESDFMTHEFSANYCT